MSKKDKDPVPTNDDIDADFDLQPQSIPAGAETPRKAAKKKTAKRAAPAPGGPDVISYRHKDHRINNPDVGLVTPETDMGVAETKWHYDPHIDPALQFDSGRAEVEKLIDDALASNDEIAMRKALEQLKRQSAPYLNWTGKAERTSFAVDTVSLHVHERIDPASILRALRKRIADPKKGEANQPDFFRAWFENPLPLREAIDFYKHERGWANRLISGDSLLVMNSLLQKESMAGQVQMIYIDPPYGIKYGSNFQPFTNKSVVKDRKDEDLTQEPEMIKAFRDTWELGIHSYLTYLRDRLLLAKELLHESGSVFVQISDENLHHVREICDEVFGVTEFVAVIVVQKTESQTSDEIASVADYLVWYAKDAAKLKYRQIFLSKDIGGPGASGYVYLANSVGYMVRGITKQERDKPATIPNELRLFDGTPLVSDSGGNNSQFPVVFRGGNYKPGANYWKTNESGFVRLDKANRLVALGNRIEYLRYYDDFPVYPLANLWVGLGERGFVGKKLYVVQTAAAVIERCILMTTDPGDLVIDPTCGSGTTAFVAEKWGRRWITCDTSRVAVTLAKQRMMTASYDYFDLKYPHEGLKSGFIYKTVPHVMLKSIVTNPEVDEIYGRMHPAIVSALAELNTALQKQPSEDTYSIAEGGRKGQKLNFAKSEALLEWEVPFDFPETWLTSVRAAFDAFHAARQAMQKKMDASIAAHADQETLFDQPQVARDKLRITGPFTVEAVPFPTVLSLDETPQTQDADMTVARSGESARQHTWRDELLKTGIRGKGGQMLRFAELETLPATRYLHCSGTVTDTGERVVVSFGPEHAALEQRQVEMAMREAEVLFPRPKMIVFCAFTFDPEAAKDIDQTKGITALKAQMNTDLLTEDLKKARASNQSFWLMGQPDVDVRKRKDGLYEVEVNGFDYFDTVKGDLVSGGKSKIAMWLLDTDYDERALMPQQVFFPMAGKDDGWHKLKKNIRAELNEDLLSQFHGTVSLPFEAGDNRKVAVKIVDDRGIESLKVIALD